MAEKKVKKKKEPTPNDIMKMEIAEELGLMDIDYGKWTSFIIDKLKVNKGKTALTAPAAQAKA